LKAVSRCGVGLTNGSAEFVELTPGLSHLAIDKAQTSDKRAHVDAGRFSNTIRNLDGGLSQCAENGLSTDATDAMLLQ
jgi:hypothetical protein